MRREEDCPEDSGDSSSPGTECCSVRQEIQDVVRQRRPQYIAIALGWAYNGLLLGLTVAAVFAPQHRLLLDFNRYGELWADLSVFSIAFVLMTWLLFFKLPQKRRSDGRRSRDGDPDEP